MNSTIGERKSLKIWLRKNKKKPCMLTNSSQKYKKVIAIIIYDYNKCSKNNIKQTTFSQYKNITLIINCL